MTAEGRHGTFWSDRNIVFSSWWQFFDVIHLPNPIKLDEKFTVCTLHITTTNFLKKQFTSLARWLSWLEHHPIHQNVVGLISSQGTQLGCEFNPQSGHIQEATNRYFSLTLTCLPLALPSSLPKINNHILRREVLKKHFISGNPHVTVTSTYIVQLMHIIIICIMSIIAIVGREEGSNTIIIKIKSEAQRGQWWDVDPDGLTSSLMNFLLIYSHCVVVSTPFHRLLSSVSSSVERFLTTRSLRMTLVLHTPTGPCSQGSRGMSLPLFLSSSPSLL